MESCRWMMLATAAGFACVAAAQFINQTSCNGKNYTYQELAGHDLISDNARDEHGDTIGGIGSAIALDRSRWKKLSNGSYIGPRVHKFDTLFTLEPNATFASPSRNNLIFTYKETVRFFGPDGTPYTGLDADGTGHISFPGFPDLPVATYQGIVLNPNGSFWISDEPYIYRFNPAGLMIGAIRPPDAIIPMRNGTKSFSADSPTFYASKGARDDVIPADNPTGRDNNHGFEGLTVTGDGNTLYVLLQGAANQEGGLNKQTERYARLVKYDITIPSAPRYAREFVVPLPLYNDPTAKALKNPKFWGHGQSISTSVYRHIDVFDIATATDIKETTYDCASCSIASDAGVLTTRITPATYCSFIDFNVNSQLNRFGVHNGGEQNASPLNEKWESIGIVPVDRIIGDDEWFVFSLIIRDLWIETREWMKDQISGKGINS
ncbi:hypothetical protein BDZ45DRAFT_714291 [Acephala macrosclerotiorum]|nr:hypothetical protein BDZ45DRAFT_714291 [Acephala macrosclerotiorum]